MSYNPEQPGGWGPPTPPPSDAPPTQAAMPMPGYAPASPGYGPPNSDAPPTQSAVPMPGYPPQPPGYPPPPAYGPPGYPGPYYPPPMMARKTNGMAVTGMVLGIISLVLFWAWFLGPVLAVLGIIFSGVGISQCNRLRQDGKGMAIAGLVCSLISAAFWVLLIIAVESYVHSL